MAYQSIGQLNTKVKPSLTYTAGAPQPVQPSSIKDVRTLNSALRTKQINQNQWNQQFKTIQNYQTPVVPSFGKSLLGNAITAAKTVARPVYKPIVDVTQGQGGKAAHDVAQLGRDVGVQQLGGDVRKNVTATAKNLVAPTSTQAQRTALISTQKVAQDRLNGVPAGSQPINTKRVDNESVVNHVRSDIVSAWQHVNPFSGRNDANKIISQAQKEYGLTSQFVNLLHNAGTSLTNKSFTSDEVKSNSGIRGEQALGGANNIQLATKDNKRDVKTTLIHEGLHQAWESNPQLRNQFISDFNKSASPRLKQYLQGVLSSYKGFKPSDLNNLSKASPEIQTEVHSFAGQYEVNVNPSDNLSHYYSQYFNPKQANAAANKDLNAPRSVPKGWTYGPVGGKNRDGEPLEGWLNPQGKPAKLPENVSTSGGFVQGLSSDIKANLNPKTLFKSAANTSPTTQTLLKQPISVNATKTVQSMLAKGADDATVQKYLKSEIAKKKASDIQTAGDAAAITGINIGDGLAVKTLGRALTKTGVKAAVGKDAAVNTLIDSQRTAGALTKVRTADRLGSPAVTDATKPAVTKIPVTDNSAPTSIGKAVTVDANTYVKKSAQLSKAYDAESAQVKNLPTPQAQKIIQGRIDTKYQTAQAELDAAAGKTTVGFNDKPTGPRSAFTTELQNQKPTPAATVEAPKTATAPKVTTSTTTAPKTPTAPSMTAKEVATENKPSGSALRTQQKAVEAGMQGEFGDVASYRGVSHKEQAAKAVQLVKDNPQKAEDIAMGRAAGDNASHEAAVYHAVKNQALAEAKRTGDFSKVQSLASSPRHTAVSEAAQKLGAEGYNLDPHDPIRIMSDVAKTRETALAKTSGKTVQKEATSIKQAVQAAKPRVSRQSWHEFVDSIKC